MNDFLRRLLWLGRPSMFEHSPGTTRSTVRPRQTRRQMGVFQTLTHRRCMAADFGMPPAFSTDAISDSSSSHWWIAGNSESAEGELTMPMIEFELNEPLVAGAMLPMSFFAASTANSVAGTFAYDVQAGDLVPTEGLIVTVTFTPDDAMAFSDATATFGFSADGRFDVDSRFDTQASGKQTDLESQDDRWLIRRGGQSAELVAIETFSDLRVIGLDSASTLTIDDQPSADSFALSFFGGPSIDTVRLTGDASSLDIASDAAFSMLGIEAIDLSAVAEPSLRIDSTALAAADDSGDGVVVLGDNVRLDLVDRGNFSLGAPVEFSGQVLTTIETFESLLSVSVASGWHNPIDGNDVDGNAMIEPLDALLVINELRAIRFHDADTDELVSLENVTFPGRFLDTDGDGFLRPLDALLVINQLRRDALAGELESTPLDEIRRTTFV